MIDRLSIRPLRLFAFSGLVLGLVALSALPALAAGKQATDERGLEVPEDRPMSLEEQAELHMRDGIRHRDKAAKYEEKAREADSPDKRAKLEQKALKAYEKATKEFAYAAQKNPESFEAFNEIGYALRKRGMYEDALRAYNAALALNPEYSNAIEYQAEAFLALERIDEAKAAYTKLLTLNQEHAAQLLAAMKEWVSSKQAEPGSTSPETVSALATWIEERDSVASQLGTDQDRLARRW